ncbi:MAG: type I DNA topoisomerase [Chitinophagales bacterium]|nr:type I DNA topoisomerase [Bacteroidota bacterium]MBK8487320.1 type I DNA topoisomerase [Bacteroidota bacterium]
MAKNLMIVESPAKAKTIEKFLGKEFIVKSCYGHIRDLEKSNFSIDIENEFAPKYVIPADKEDVVKELKKLAKGAEEIWLATDEDREGEAISWHLCEVLGLDPKEAKRIVFHEITKSAIQKAVDNPRNLNMDLVNAQQARRVLDRLVGFELSPLLWKKINLSRSLSAGRVQSVAVRLLVERENEIIDFTATNSFKVAGIFAVNNGKKTAQLKAELNQKFDQEKEAKDFLDKCIGAEFTVADITVKPGKRSPSAPFTTSTLQQEASAKLGYSVSRTMVVAQKLYEEGHITYMRTDSVNLSELAIDAAKTEIVKQFGEKYSNPRKYKTKSSGAQEAHEAIRPTYMEAQDIEAGNDEKRLYKLIWRRTLASQMSDAELEKTNVTIDISTRSEKFHAKGEVIIFDGFLKLYTESKDDDVEQEDDSIIPPLNVNDNLTPTDISATERFTRPAPRYTEASLVRKLEELGIGRPSTYAPTISTIQKREYAIKQDKDGLERKYVQLNLSEKEVKRKVLTEITGAEKSKLFPTDLGMLVTQFLVENFMTIMDFNFTAKVEEQFDEIAVGKINWPKMIGDFYFPFHKTLEETEKTAQRVTGERQLGVAPDTGLPVSVRMGKYGPIAVMGDTQKEEKPKFAGLLKSQNMQTITLDEALELFKLPKSVGEYEGKEVVAAIGRFGPYVRWNSKFYSIPKHLEAISITLAESIELIKIKDEKDANKIIHDWPENEIQILNGRYGPYIKKGKENYRIPKGTEAAGLSLEEVNEIIATSKPTGGGKTKGGAKGKGNSKSEGETKSKASTKAKSGAKPKSKKVKK